MRDLIFNLRTQSRMDHTRITASRQTNAAEFKCNTLARAISQATLWGAAALASAAAPTMALAQATEAQARIYSIPPGSLEDTLNRFGREAGILLSFIPENTANQRSPGLQGSYSVEAGLASLLAGSGLQATRQSNGSYVLTRSQGATGASGDASLPRITVTASREQESPWRSAPGYVAKRTASATKTDTPTIEAPQALSVVTRDQMDEQGAAPALQDALRYTPGLIGTRGVNLTDDSFNLRGFAAGLATSSNTPVFRDGLRESPAMYASTVESYGLERIDVVRGPGSVLFGQVAPGGIVNVTSKRPTDVPLHELEVQAGSHNHRQVGMDLGGPLDEEGAWSYRLTAMARDADTQTDYIPNDREYLAAALTWRPTVDTSLTLLASYQHTLTAYNWGLPVAGSVLSNPNGQLPRSLFTGEPGFDKYDTETTSVGYQFEHRFSDTWRLRQNARYFHSDMIWNSAYGSGLQTANQQLLNRFAFIRADDYTSYNVDTQVQASWRHGMFEHTTLTGVDYSFVPWTRNERRGTVAALNLFNPNYGATITPNAQPSRVLQTDTTQIGVYLQEQIKIDKQLVLVAGLRNDRARSDISGYLTNGSASSARTPVNLQNEVTATTGRVGAVYLFDSGWAPYVSTSTSFEPESGSVDYNNQPFKPTRGLQHEAGLKYEPAGQPLSVTAAVFDLTRNDVLTADPNHTGYSVQTGEIKSRGFEFEAKGKPTSNWETVAAYTLTDAKITRSNNGDEGKSPAGVPRHNIALWGTYRFPQEALRGLKTGVGVRRIMGTSGYVLGATPTPAELPDYTVVDAMIGFEQDAWTYTLNISNLLDETYVQSCYYATTTCFYGDGRNAIARAIYRW